MQETNTSRLKYIVSCSCFENHCLKIINITGDVFFNINFRNHKVVGVRNNCRAEISSAQTGEKPTSLELIDNLQKGIEYDFSYDIQYRWSHLM